MRKDILPPTTFHRNPINTNAKLTAYLSEDLTTQNEALMLLFRTLDLMIWELLS